MPKYGKRIGATRRSAAVVMQKKRKAAYIGNKRLNPIVRALVDRRIHKNEETCEIITNTGGYQQATGAITEGDWLRLIPAIAQGDTRENRSGAKIKLVSFHVKGYVHFVPDNVTDGADSLLGRMIICESKESKIFDIPSRTTVSNQLLRDGDDSHNYNGTIVRHFQPINTPLIKLIKQKYFKIVSNRLQTGGAGAELHTHTRNIVVKPFNFRIPCKNKILRYQLGEAYPDSWNPMIAMGTADINNPSTTDIHGCQYFYQVTMRWKNM